jgi:hypothetical protein
LFPFSAAQIEMKLQQDKPYAVLAAEKYKDMIKYQFFSKEYPDCVLVNSSTERGLPKVVIR